MACLIILCDKETNKILETRIWSSPEWEQSRTLDGVYTYVAYSVRGYKSFAEAKEQLLYQIEWSDRYKRLMQYYVD
jgi:hypothetical protein